MRILILRTRMSRKKLRKHAGVEQAIAYEDVNLPKGRVLGLGLSQSSANSHLQGFMCVTRNEGIDSSNAVTHSNQYSGIFVELLIRCCPENHAFRDLVASPVQCLCSRKNVILNEAVDG